ncbi:MAG TPA: hypothetical protein VHN99_07565 [Deinococcales bacterium]|nr:hypothetical protein [Deinococcales bacterium]
MSNPQPARAKQRKQNGAPQKQLPAPKQSQPAMDDGASQALGGLEAWAKENPLMALAGAMLLGYVSAATGVGKAPVKATGLVLGGAADLTGGTIRGAASLTGETVKGAGSLAAGTVGALVPLAAGAAGAVGHVGSGAASAVGHVGGGAARATVKLLEAAITLAPLVAVAYVMDANGLLRPRE